MDRETIQWLFVNTTYYLLLGSVLAWVGIHLREARPSGWHPFAAWTKENWRGIAVAFAVTAIAGWGLEPALRVLSDEANLLGTSKNLFASKTATFTISGKNYYGSYWDIDAAIDQRPPLFPFLVSLVHGVAGYSYRNVFAFNLFVLPGFVFLSYRLAKSLGGETFGVVASLCVAAHPITLLSARSGGFDLFVTAFALLVVKSVLDVLRDPSPGKLATLWLNLCLFAEARYETALFIPPVVALLLFFKAVTWNKLRPYAFVYALTPVVLLPRLWQAFLLGSVPHQEPGTVTFSARNFFDNLHEYFEPVFSPFESYPAHSALLIALGVVGAIGWLRWLWARIRAGSGLAPESRFALVAAAWMLLQAVIVFTYYWGQAQYPSAARIVIPIDTFFSFAAAWVLARSLERWGRSVPVLIAVAILAVNLPAAPQRRMMNRLIQSRENAATWRFFESLDEKRILIVTDRPSHFTIMEYGAMSFDAARRDTYLFTALERRLFLDVYVIQQIRLSTKEPLPGYAIWPDRKLDPVLEFQNDADVLVRVSRLAR
jgi:hypothetical protein